MQRNDIANLQPYDLTREEAQALLDNFLSVNREIFETCGGLEDFSLEYSLDSVFAYVVKALDRISFDRVPTELDSKSGMWLTRAAFYFGESLVRASNRLGWAIGEQDTADQNMPVIKGFSGNQEANVVMILKNLAMRVKLDGEPLTTVLTALEYWFAAARQQ